MKKKTSKSSPKKKTPQSVKASVKKASDKAVKQIRKEEEGQQLKAGYAVQVENVIRDKDTHKISSQTFLPYVGSKKMPLTLQMAESHREGLKRTGAGGRIITVPEMEVHETWESLATLESAQKEETLSQQGVPHGAGAGAHSGTGGVPSDATAPSTEKST